MSFTRFVPGVAMYAHSSCLKSLFIFSKPPALLGIVRQKEEDQNPDNNCRHSFKNKQPPPRLEPSDSIHMSDAVCDASAVLSAKAYIACFIKDPLTLRMLPTA